jgi:hypothetical protein
MDGSAGLSTTGTRCGSFGAGITAEPLGTAAIRSKFTFFPHQGAITTSGLPAIVFGGATHGDSPSTEPLRTAMSIASD